MQIGLVYALNYALVIAWGISVAYSLIKLRNMAMNSTARAIWVAVIVIAPFIGALAFLVVSGKPQA